jgi:hypothetical protein
MGLFSAVLVGFGHAGRTLDTTEAMDTKYPVTLTVFDFMIRGVVLGTVYLKRF